MAKAVKPLLMRFYPQVFVLFLGGVCLLTALPAFSQTVALCDLELTSDIAYFTARVVDRSSVEISRHNHHLTYLPVNLPVQGMQFDHVNGEVRLIVRVPRNQFQIWIIRDAQDSNHYFLEPVKVLRGVSAQYLGNDQFQL